MKPAIDIELIGPHFDMNGFADWFAKARPGERVCYFTGELARVVDKQEDHETVGLASVTYRYSDERKVCLTQVKLADFKFAYMATKRGKQHANAEPVQAKAA